MSYCFFFFKQKTAYEMRISDWSSDVCSSDLHDEQVCGLAGAERGREAVLDAVLFHAAERRVGDDDFHPLLRPPADQRPRQGVVVAHVQRHIDALQDQVGRCQQDREEHPAELQSLMRISYADSCLTKTKTTIK